MDVKYHPHWIRHLAGSRDRPLVAAGEFERHVSVWNVATEALVSSFETVLDFGGSRLALSHDGEQCLAAAYNRRGLACYSAKTGAVVWERLDLKGTQKLHLSHDGHSVYASLECRPCHQLSLRTGETIATWRGIRSVCDGGDGRVYMAPKEKNPYVLAARRRLMELPRETFAILSACFFGEKIAITESGGDTRCFGPAGELLWRYQPPRGSHVLQLSQGPAGETLLGIEWPYEKGGPYRFLTFTDTGRPILLSELQDTWETAFCDLCTRLVTSRGAVIDTGTGIQIGQLPFPV